MEAASAPVEPERPQVQDPDEAGANEDNADGRDEEEGPVHRPLIRALFSFVSFGLCLSGFWLALFDRKGQTLHDKLTRTFVVRPL